MTTAPPSYTTSRDVTQLKLQDVDSIGAETAAEVLGLPPPVDDDDDSESAPRD